MGVYDLAKKMVEEIILAEETGGKIIADAKKQADEIIKNSSKKSEDDKAKIINEARIEAQDIIEKAKRTAESMQDTAKQEAKTEEKGLNELYNANLSGAVDAVINLLAE